MDVVVGREEGIAEVFKQVFFEIIEFSSTEIVESLDLNQSFTHFRPKLLRNSDDCGVNFRFLNFLDELLSISN